MYRLHLGASLVGAALLCNCLVGGCRPRDKDAVKASPVKASPAAAEPVQAGDRGENNKASHAPAVTEAAAKGDMSAHTAAELVAPPTEPVPTDRPPEASWSTQRLVLLAPGGPRAIDLRLNVHGNDLAAGLAKATDWLADELELDLSAPVAWEALLEKPLVQSGWFGNLVPSTEQRAELLAMYDKENVGTVDTSEFQAFVTRGLSRRDHIRLVQGRAEAPLMRSESPWGPLDQDEDGQLSQQELSGVRDALLHYDFDGDAIISDRELRSSNEAMADAMNRARSSGLLDLTSVLMSDPKQPSALERAVLEHYTFADTIPRELFFGWKERRWKEFDPDGDQEIAQRDLAPLHDALADARVDIVLPDSLIATEEATEEGAEFSITSNSPHDQGDVTQALWTAGPRGGRLLLPGCVVLIQVRDDHNWQARRLTCQQFARALDEAQLATAVAGRFELKENAWDLLRELGADNATLAWQWLASSRHFHVSVSWTTVDTPWFELLDNNADRRLTAGELLEFSETAKRWDRNSDGKLQEEERPLVVSLTVAREDSRVANFAPGGTNTEKGGRTGDSAPSWFTGMDYNLDGELTHAEFLGEDSAFGALDADGDGIIDVREVYAPH